MRRYLVFCGDVYYPLGGMDDFLAQFDNFDEAKKSAIEWVESDSVYEDKEDIWSFAWAQIYDTETAKIIWDK